MGVSWTTEQQQVIDLRNRNILVSAAAGSGKTAVLVERIVKIITDKNHPIKFYLFLKKTNIRHTRTIILKIPAIFLISMNIRKTKILLYYLQQNIFKPQISHLLTEHSDL
jgi:replicative superfamily II helicase